jgi:Glycosyl hydrolase family 115/Gylcosyl hydrolase family 115 C-terminal domain
MNARKTLFHFISVFFLAAIVLQPQIAHALGEKLCVSFTPATDSFALSTPESAAPIYVDNGDWLGVQRAVFNLGSDIAQVTGRSPELVHQNPLPAEDIVIIGTLGRNPLIDKLIAQHKLDVSSIAGHWESALIQTISHPFPGVRSALVIAGADKRGTIFAVYGLSEQIGVSPWSWWADVPSHHHDALYIVAGTYLQPEPRVRYRGIFLNDEAPALTGWVNEKFGGYNHHFYEHVFDLLLRLKANFLWPAMWNSAFAADDPLNAELADEYGIVMSTSHEEPMMRAEKEWTRGNYGAWDYTKNAKAIDDFWRAGMERDKSYEQVVTLGMRGANDTPMSAETNTQLLEKIVADQRQILTETVNPDITKIPQVWALYKEVQGYYEKGMRVPDDVTLLWSDDNWGNLRRLPTAEERKRPGGAGIYYHFDYVGGPRSYKWINTNPIPKISEQMHLALDYGADRIWVVNVGDLKPMEFPIEFFLSLARTPERWDKDHLAEFTQLWTTREFGPEHADSIADLLSTYAKFNGRRKPELLDPTTFSLTQDREAERIDEDWRALTARAEQLNTQLPVSRRPAFFELVLYPLKASAIVTEMYIAAARNQLYARQGRSTANQYASETRELFAQDAALSDEYNHKLLNGRWNHMMDQTHIGYTFWNEPPLNAMPAVQQVQPLAGAHMLVFPEAGNPLRPALPTFDSINHQTYRIELANRGTESYQFSAKPSAPWIHLSKSSGAIETGDSLDVSIDWDQLPSADDKGNIVITQQGPNNAERPVTVQIEATKLSSVAEITGFIENNGVIAIEAEHFTNKHDTDKVSWQKLPDLGSTLSAMTPTPATAASDTAPTSQTSACLDYQLYLFHAGANTIETILAPTLNFVPGRGLRFALGLDDAPLTNIDVWPTNFQPGNTQPEWEKAVSDGVRRVSTPVTIDQPGPHTLHLCMVDPAVVVERIIVRANRPPLPRAPTEQESYLGPPESTFIPSAKSPSSAAHIFR